MKKIKNKRRARGAEKEKSCFRKQKTVGQQQLEDPMSICFYVSLFSSAIKTDDFEVESNDPLQHYSFIFIYVPVVVLS